MSDRTEASDPQLGDLLRSRLGSHLEPVALSPGETLFRQGDPADALYLVAEGRLRALFVRQDGAEVPLADVGPGDFVGELGLLTGGARTATVVAVEPTQLLRAGRTDFERLAESDPALIARMAGALRARLLRSQLAAALDTWLGRMDPAMFGDFASEIEWVSLGGGDTLCRQGEPADCLYLVLSGRLRATVSGRPVREIGPGESVGEMALLTGEARSADVHAIRDSALARLSAEGFQRLAARHPALLTATARLLVRRLRASEAAAPMGRQVTSLALLPLDAGVPAERVAAGLTAALGALGPTLHLTSQSFDRLTGVPGAAGLGPDAPRAARLTAWLDEQEARHRFILFQADAAPTPWTRRCLRHADQVLLLGLASGDPAPGSVERAALPAERAPTGPRRVLVLLHPDGRHLPANTAAWLDARSCDGHHHVRLDTPGDFGRLARCLTGQAVGVALGGGAARGLAHLGVLRALAEAGVPVDMIAGTSMGAVVAAAHAMGMSYETALEQGHTIFVKGRPHKEYTLPILSLIRSRRLDRMLAAVYGDAQIEDLWLPCLCVSCDLTATDLRVHRRGLLWRAVRASSAVPGVFLPVIEGRSLLVDGGVLNNLPGDLLRRAGCAHVIVVEVNPPTELTVDCAEFPSPWRALWDRLRRRPGGPRVPGIIEILSRTLVVTSDRQSREVKRDAALCLQPPLERFGWMQFESLREIAEAAYHYTRERLQASDRPPWLAGLIGDARLAQAEPRGPQPA